MNKPATTEFKLTTLGRKDDQGRQVRIEHRTRYTRISRTGGAAVRAQMQAAGINLTVNSSHGVRLSKGVLKGTQVALQHGKFRLRGRYGDGPTKVNLSKSGVTVSTRNQLGSFNWIKPNRSSAKLFGVQVRGKKAAQLHLLYAIFFLVYQALGFLVNTVVLVLKLLLLFAQQLYYRINSLLTWARARSAERQQVRRCRALNAALQDANNLPPTTIADLQTWELAQQQAAIIWIIGAWGQAQSDLSLLTSWQTAAATSKLTESAWQHAFSRLEQIAPQLNALTQQFDPQLLRHEEMRLLTWLADRLPKIQASLDWILDLDEWLIDNQGGRSALQTAMYDRLMACLGVGVAS